MTRRLALVTAACALFATQAFAGDIADQGAAAEQLLDEGQYAEAAAALEDAQVKLREAMPLAVRRALFVAAEPGGFGVYNPRENAVFKKGEPIIVYAEPLGYGYKQDGSLYVLALGVDVVVKDSAGVEIGRKDDFGELSFQSRYKNNEFFAKLNYDFSGLPAGDYQVTSVLRDKVTGKTVEFTLPFSMSE
jgi:hypothetical protein